MATWTLLGIAFVLVLGLFSVRTAHGPDTTRDYDKRPLPGEPEPVLLPSAPLDEEFFPCSDCHEGEKTNRRVRVLEEEHDSIDFQHGDLWCLACHKAEDRDRLHLADRTLIEFDESWRLCTQCHGKKLADWRAGVHGKRTGHWRGPKEFRTCVACHDPHRPPFKPLEPKPPPKPPTQIVLKGYEMEETPHGEH